MMVSQYDRNHDPPVWQRTPRSVRPRRQTTTTPPTRTPRRACLERRYKSLGHGARQRRHRQILRPHKGPRVAVAWEIQVRGGKRDGGGDKNVTINIGGGGNKARASNTVGMQRSTPPFAHSYFGTGAEPTSTFNRNNTHLLFLRRRR